MDRLHLKWKIFSFLLGFCAFLLVILWLLQTVFLNDTYKIIRKRELERVIATVEREIDNPDLQSVIYRIQNENDVVIAPTWEFVQPQRGLEYQPQGGRGTPPFDAITETREFQFKNGQTMSFTFYALIVPVSSTVTTLRTQLYLVTGVMVVFSVVFAVIIAKRVSRPIEDISRSAQSLAKGVYDTRFDGKGFYEIVSLSDTLNRAAAELGRVEGLRRELLANVSHDLRTPLALIYSYSEMMHDFPGEITGEQTQLIMDETKRLTTLVNDVLDISKLEDEMESLNITRYNLTQRVLATTERMNELLKRQGFVIGFTFDGEAWVSADEGKLDRVVYNLLINAVNYSGGSRRVDVKQTVAENRVRISVTDNGEGIPEADLPFIWERYYKSRASHTRAITGTGLGLSIVKKIMDLHGGAYGAASELGEGSTFWVELRGVGLR